MSDPFDGVRRGPLIAPFGRPWLLASRRVNVSCGHLKARFDLPALVGGDAWVAAPPGPRHHGRALLRDGRPIPPLAQSVAPPLLARRPIDIVAP